MLQKIGFSEFALILVIAFLLFGAGKLPQLGKSLGEGIREFKKAFQSINEDASQESQSEKKDR